MNAKARRLGIPQRTQNRSPDTAQRNRGFSKEGAKTQSYFRSELRAFAPWREKFFSETFVLFVSFVVNKSEKTMSTKDRNISRKGAKAQSLKSNSELGAFASLSLREKSSCT
jgi:hypothetical protein